MQTPQVWNGNLQVWIFSTTFHNLHTHIISIYKKSNKLNIIGINTSHSLPTVSGILLAYNKYKQIPTDLIVQGNNHCGNMKSIKKKRSMASHRKLHFQKVLGSMIVALALLFAGSAGAQETKTIKGMVRDVTGEPLIGASVIEKGTNNGVITDVDGNFTLTVPADATLSIAYMGYATREIHLAKRKKQGDLRVTLREDSQQLKEVVVTAMGIKKDTKRLGYAVSTIESDEIVKAGATNFASAMYGKAPGIRITQTQGGSAGAVSINVRGLTSITGNNRRSSSWTACPSATAERAESTDFAEFGNDGQIRSNGLVDINPEDIESVSVLKGASATALYGSEAANGAVVITSKRAKSGKLTVDFTAQVTANLPAYLPKVQTVYGRDVTTRNTAITKNRRAVSTNAP